MQKGLRELQMMKVGRSFEVLVISAGERKGQWCTNLSGSRIRKGQELLHLGVVVSGV